MESDILNRFFRIKQENANSELKDIKAEVSQDHMPTVFRYQPIRTDKTPITIADAANYLGVTIRHWTKMEGPYYKEVRRTQYGI